VYDAQSTSPDSVAVLKLMLVPVKVYDEIGNSKPFKNRLKLPLTGM
jgi:hypothetical protein